MSKVYVLPELDYAYEDLAPVISAEIMKLHHSKHHQGYVNGANAALEALEQARKGEKEIDTKAVLKSLSFNLNGHILHTIFWKNLRKPSEDNAPSSELKAKIEADFNSFEAFKAQFSAAAKGVEGSGWCALLCDNEGNLFISQVENHNKLVLAGMQPVLVIDVWEHAYYLDYKNDRGAYVESFWKAVNWDDVEDRINSSAK